MKIYPFDIAEMLAFLTSILCFKFLRKTPFVYFVPYLAMIVVVELVGKYLGHTGQTAFNIKVYNVSTVIEFLFFYYLFYACIIKRVFKKAIVYLSALFFICTVFNQAFIQGFNVFHSYTVLLGTVIIIVFVFLYFYDAFENVEPVNLIKEPMFWMSMGIFLFYLGGFTFNLMYPYLVSHNLQREKRLFSMINNNLIIVMYVSFITGLILCSRSRSVLKQQ